MNRLVQVTISKEGYKVVRDAVERCGTSVSAKGRELLLAWACDVMGARGTVYEGPCACGAPKATWLVMGSGAYVCEACARRTSGAVGQVGHVESSSLPKELADSVGRARVEVEEDDAAAEALADDIAAEVGE